MLLFYEAHHLSKAAQIECAYAGQALNDHLLISLPAAPLVPARLKLFALHVRRVRSLILKQRSAPAASARDLPASSHCLTCLVSLDAAVSASVYRACAALVVSLLPGRIRITRGSVRRDQSFQIKSAALRRRCDPFESLNRPDLRSDLLGIRLDFRCQVFVFLIPREITNAAIRPTTQLTS